MNAKVIGIGAAGNKAAITLIEKDILSRNSVMLLNSTLKDVPASYKDLAIQFSNSIGGCGKERDIAKQLALDSIKDGTAFLDGFLDPTDDTVIIVNSSEGGTGCGASVIIAKYFKEVLGANVHLFVFTGFEEDGRGLQNTVEYFQEINDKYTVEAISNKKFLEETGNKFKAEKAANEAFAMRIKILLGQIIVDSDQNIDETDLYKVSTTPGFMMIDYTPLTKIKNVDDFNKTMVAIIDHTKSLDISKPSAKRLGVIFNVSEKIEDFVDFSANAIRERLGSPYEYFYHVQHEGDTDFVAYIASGMDMPIDEIQEVYEKYKEMSSKVNKDKDNFFDTISNLRGNPEDSMFNSANRSGVKSAVTAADKNAFLASFNMPTPNDVKSSKFSNTKMNTTSSKDPKDQF